MAPSYSATHRVMQALKFALPLIAALALGVLFFVLREVPVTPGRATDDGQSRPTIAQKIESPMFEGSTRNGALISVGAAAVEANTTDGTMIARQIAARLQYPQNGPRFLLTAPKGALTVADTRAKFTGGVRAQSSAGFSFSTEIVTLVLDPIVLSAPTAVRARHPLGDIDAGSIRISANQGGVKIDFQDGVRLLYKPQNK